MTVNLLHFRRTTRASFNVRIERAKLSTEIDISRTVRAVKFKSNNLSTDTTRR